MPCVLGKIYISKTELFLGKYVWSLDCFRKKKSYVLQHNESKQNVHLTDIPYHYYQFTVIFLWMTIRKNVFMSKQGGHVYTPFSRKENFLSFNFSQKTWQVWHFKYLGMGKLLLFFISIAIYWRTFTKEKSIPSTNFSTFNSLSNKAFWKIKLIDDAMEKVTGFL